MASNNRRTPRNTKTGSSAMGIQRKINRDYATLARDYGKLAVELWQKPVTKFVLAGVAIGAVVSLARKNPQISSFVSENVGALRTRIDDVIHSGEEAIS
jgi:cytochrome c biogenesis factor